MDILFEDYKLLITGNGFDLAHGLPTKYSDFIELITFLLQDDIQGFEVCLKKKVLAINYNTEAIDYANIIGEFRNLEIDKETKNLIYYFGNLNEINTWVDFETGIKEIIEMIYQFQYLYDKNHIGFLPSGKKYRILSRANVEIDERISIESNLDKISRLYNFFESGEIKPIYTLQNGLVDMQLIIQNLEESVKGLECVFSWYISNVIDKILSVNLPVNDNQLLQTTNYHISFNYTKTLDKLYSNKQINDKTYHIHGSSKNKNVLFGFDYEGSVDNNLIRPFTKIFKRIHYNTDYAAIYMIEREISEKIRGMDTPTLVSPNIILQIYFWGHSLNPTDSDIIKKIFNMEESLKSLSLKVNFIVYYHDLNSKYSQINNLFEILGSEKVENYTSLGILNFEEFNNEMFQGSEI